MEERTLLDYVSYRRDRAFEALAEIDKLLEHDMLATAMSRVYYSGFYIVSALLLFDGFSTSKHRQLIGFFNREYIKTHKIPLEVGSILGESYGKRVAVDYQDFVTLTKSQVEDLYQQMSIFVDCVNKLIEERIPKGLES